MASQQAQSWPGSAGHFHLPGDLSQPHYPLQRVESDTSARLDRDPQSSETDGDRQKRENQVAKPLKRFNACHACRRRKLKCDGQRPYCSACLRQQALDESFPKPGETEPPGKYCELNCLWDDEKEARQREKAKRAMAASAAKLDGQGGSAARRGKMVVMQEKIATLERKLTEATSGPIHPVSMPFSNMPYMPPSAHHQMPPYASPIHGFYPPGSGPYMHGPPHPHAEGSSGGGRVKHWDGSSSGYYTPSSMPGHPESHPSYPAYSNSSSPPIIAEPLPRGNAFVETSPSHDGPMLPEHRAGPSVFAGSSVATVAPMPSSAGKRKMQPESSISGSGWPPTLPPPDVVQHLVQLFFQKGGYHAKTLDRPNFWRRMGLPPTHQDFPYLGTLHAICAAMSRYSGNNTDPPSAQETQHRGLSDWSPDSPVAQYDSRNTGSIAFRTRHAKLAVEIIDYSLETTQPLFECLQASIIMSLYYSLEAKMTKAWTSPGLSARLAMSLGIYQKRTSEREGTMTPAHKRESDMTMWTAYAIDKQSSAITGWPMAWNDSDVTLPLPTKEEIPGENSVYMTGIQDLNSPDIFDYHPTEHRDSMNMYIKSQILMSRVLAYVRKVNVAQDKDISDLRCEFHVHRSQIDRFLLGIPIYLRGPLKANGLDTDMLICLCTCYLSVILLHEVLPSLDDTQPQYHAAATTAANAILSLIRSLLDTTVDFQMIPVFCAFTFFYAGKVLAGDLAQAVGKTDQAAFDTLNQSLDTIRLMMIRLGTGFTQMYSLVDGMQSQILRDSQMTVWTQNFETTVKGPLPALESPQFPTSYEVYQPYAEAEPMSFSHAQDHNQYLQGPGDSVVVIPGSVDAYGHSQMHFSPPLPNAGAGMMQDYHFQQQDPGHNLHNLLYTEPGAGGLGNQAMRDGSHDQRWNY